MKLHLHAPMGWHGVASFSSKWDSKSSKKTSKDSAKRKELGSTSWEGKSEILLGMGEGVYIGHVRGGVRWRVG